MKIGDILDKHYKEDNLNIICSEIEKIYDIEKLDKYFKKVYKSYYTLEEVLYLYIQLLIDIKCSDCDSELKEELFILQFKNIRLRKCKEHMHILAYVNQRINLDKLDLIRRAHPILGSAYRYYPKYLKLKEDGKNDEEIMKEMGYGKLAYKNFLLGVQAMDVCYLDAPASDGGSRDNGKMDFLSSKVFQSKNLESEYEENEDLKALYEIIDNLTINEKDFIMYYIENDSWTLLKEHFSLSEEQAKPRLISITTKVKREFLKRRGY